MKLKYGKNSVNLEIQAKNLLGILEPKNKPVKALDVLLKNSIMKPSGKGRLGNLLRKNKPGDLVIIVSDITRSITKYSEILKFLVSEIVDAGIEEKNIEFVVALGTHPQHTQEENRILYGDLTRDFQFSSHDCHNNLISAGKTRTGLEVQVNKRVWEADFVIATGKINFHYLAGFSGGRKSILPGISSYETIRGNHCKLRHNGVSIAETKNNVIAQEMNEAGRLFDVDYLLNVVEIPQKDTAQIFCGDPELAFEEGIKFLKSIRTIKISEKADCAIVSVGGYPKDKDFYNSHKSLNLAMNAIEPSGSMILIAQCCEGFGNKKFLQYMCENSLTDLLNYPEEKIEVGGHRAFVTAKIIKDHKIYVLSDLDSNILNKMNFIPVSTLEEAINFVKKDYGEEFKTYIIPDGKSVFPSIDER